MAFTGPITDSFTLDESPAPYYLFGGEETGAVAIQGNLRRIAPDSQILGFLEADCAEEEWSGPPEIALLPWVHRGGQDALPTGALVSAVRALDLPPAPGKAYFTGECSVCLALKCYLMYERGWPREQVHVRPFWIRDQESVKHYLAQLGGKW
jgi:NADPH-dependent ferric siderophore reductase